MDYIPGIHHEQQHNAYTNDYDEIRLQYATGSYGAEHRMNPGLIVEVKSKEDIAKAITYAKSKKIAVAVRTGGHQFSGASSTTSANIQLDLKNSFKNVSEKPDEGDLRFHQTSDAKGIVTSYVYTSVSWNVGEFYKFLTDNKVFVPHGLCTMVGLGGHVQTGGFGQLVRSFGLLADHVRSLEIVDHNGDIRDNITKDDKETKDLFFALLGGSPGNLGVITHFTIEVYRDNDYNFSEDLMPRGLRSVHAYDPVTLKSLLNIVVEMSGNEEWPRNYDLTVSVYSEDFPMVALTGEDEYTKMRKRYPGIFDNEKTKKPLIIVFAQWVPFAETDDVVEAEAWFTRILKCGYLIDGKVKRMSMSKLINMWLFEFEREFDHAYIKRLHLTDSTDLGRGGWAGWISGRIDEFVQPDDNNIWVSAQFQCAGGENSKFVTNAGNGTSYSWRDSTVGFSLDCFYGTHVAKESVIKWHEENDKELIGEGGKFCENDRRLLWASYGNFDLDAVWNCYYDSREKYEALGQARQAADPDGVFTPNKFCVKRISNK